LDGFLGQLFFCASLSTSDEEGSYGQYERQEQELGLLPP
jgi:hypothetical protein